MERCYGAPGGLDDELAAVSRNDVRPARFGLKMSICKSGSGVFMKIRLGVFPRWQMRVVRGLACAALLILAACIGGTTSAGFFMTPWEQGRGPNPAFARQVVAYPTHERPGTLIIDPASHFLYFIHNAGQAIRYGVGVGREGFVWSGRATVHSKQVCGNVGSQAGA
jgi:hypothetical protein